MADKKLNEEITETKGIKILVAEDEESNYLYLEKLLSKSGFIILKARNGIEAIEKVKIIKDIAIVLMDIKMPSKNGVEATKEIKQFCPELPVVATTAFAFPGDKEAFLNEGFDGYIAKPIKADVLLKIINTLLT